ncbi:MAG: hypothetical protein KBA26_03490 [Candidatus Delongbacteria bacterium]|nr:hypothetical protein [Candidatus Delongbacteria bacterium]
MKKGLIASILALLVVVIFLIVMIVKNNNLKNENVQVNQVFSEATQTINDIESSLDRITSNELMIEQISGSKEISDSGAESKKSKILGTIQTIDDHIKFSKQKIQELEDKLSKSDVRIEGLEKIILKLNKSLNEKESFITRLKSTVDTLNFKISNLEEIVKTEKEKVQARDQEIEQNKEEISKQEADMYTIFYAIGTKKQLKEQGIIEEKGGILGIRKTTQMSSEMNMKSFKSLNLIENTTFKIEKELNKIKVVSPHNPNSFTLTAESETSSIFQVIDKEEFRKIKYLVIVVD